MVGARRVIALLACLLSVSLAMPVHADATRAAIQAEIARLKGRDFGCTRMRKLYRDLRIRYPDYHFAFAGRKAATITGIRGCGYDWGTSRDVAERGAMAACRRIEAQLGTGPKGERTCRFID